MSIQPKTVVCTNVGPSNCAVLRSTNPVSRSSSFARVVNTRLKASLTCDILLIPFLLVVLDFDFSSIVYHFRSRVFCPVLS
jgi:hypothetical protein